MLEVNIMPRLGNITKRLEQLQDAQRELKENLAAINVMFRRGALSKRECRTRLKEDRDDLRLIELDIASIQAES
jgi:exonuclease VII small subunit